MFWGWKVSAPTESVASLGSSGSCRTCPTFRKNYSVHFDDWRRNDDKRRFFCSASSSTFSRLSRFLKDSLELSFRSSRRWMPRIDRNLDPLPCPEGLKLNRLSSNWLETCQLSVSYRIAAELGTCIGSYAALPTCRSIVHNFVWQVCHENISTFIIKHVKLYLRSMRIRTKLPPTALLTV